MTSSSFRAFLSLATIEVAVCAAQHQAAHTFAKVTLQLWLHPLPPPRRVVSNTLLHLARMPRIVCIAPRNPRKQRVRPPRRNEKKERERRETSDERRIVASCMYLLYITVHAFSHRTSRLSLNPQRDALRSVPSFFFRFYIDIRTRLYGKKFNNYLLSHYYIVDHSLPF